MGRGVSISDFERGQIKALFNQGISIRKIAQEIGRSAGLVQHCIERGPDNTPCKSTGRQKTLSSQDLRNIRRHASNRIVSAKQIKAELNLQVSESTAYRAMASTEYLEHRMMLKRPRITKASRAERTTFATEHVHWMDEWNHTIFSDEKKFNLDGPDGWSSYWHDLRKEPLIFSKRQQGGGSVMVWLAISHQRTSPICFIEETLNSNKFIQLLSKELEPLVRDLEGLYHEEIYFQQDNAPVHSSHATQDWLDNHGITVLDWPSISPDLNPVENVFGILARRLYAENRQFSTVAELHAGILEAWEEVTWDDIQKTINSMHSRMIAVIAEKGGSTDY
jgi:transposase